jgi:hypothetical protein
VTDRREAGATDAPATAPSDPAPRKRDGLWLLRQAGLYLALFFGAALIIGGTSALAHRFGYDLDSNTFGRFLILGVYGIGALAMLLRFGG